MASKTVLPSSAGKGIGKGVELFGGSTGSGLEVLGKGLGYLFACIGDRIKGGNLPNCSHLLLEDTGSKLIETSKKIPVIPAQPTSLADSLKFQEDENLRKFIKNIFEEVVYREQEGKELPKNFNDTDNLLAIEKRASETNDNDLSKLWAKIFVDEALNPNSIDKKTIKIIDLIDKDVALYFQDYILPFCDLEGHIFSNIEKNHFDMYNKMIEFELIRTSPVHLSYKDEVIEEMNTNLEYDYIEFHNFYIAINPNSEFYINSVTSSGKTILKVLKGINTPDFNKIIDYCEKSIRINSF